MYVFLVDNVIYCGLCGLWVRICYGRYAAGCNC